MISPSNIFERLSALAVILALEAMVAIVYLPIIGRAQTNPPPAPVTRGECKMEPDWNVAVGGSKVMPSVLRGVGIDQRLEHQIPLNLMFRDATCIAEHEIQGNLMFQSLVNPHTAQHRRHDFRASYCNIPIRLHLAFSTRHRRRRWVRLCPPDDGEVDNCHHSFKRQDYRQSRKPFKDVARRDHSTVPFKKRSETPSRGIITQSGRFLSS